MKALPAAALVLALAAARPASASLMADNCRLDLRFFHTVDGVHAIVQVDAVWGALIEAELNLELNGQVMKLDPVFTNTQQVWVAWLAPANTAMAVCATVEGKNWITSEAWLPAEERDCEFFNSETGSGFQQPRTPGGLGGAMPREPALRRSRR